ncbi:Ribonuclease H1 [Trametes pubescens]|uniref:ribonuclease H n=1 Tax=Trametes pubescens TaxID=154538 RepID=A0A1M2VMF2_TRAPU|nr:Ribonuclease H1 [Trametes pubescens]
MPKCLKAMVMAAKRYNVKCEASNPTAALCAQLPVWNHIGRNSERGTENSPACKCLRDAHQVRTVGQCVAVAERLQQERGTHVPRSTCECDDCLGDRTLLGCENPHRCAVAAARLIGRLTEKWDPNREGNKDGLTLTTRRKRENGSARVANERILFDPSLATDTPVAESMRVFVPLASGDPKRALRHAARFQVEPEAVEVFTDGSCKGNGSGCASAGSGVWFGEDDERNEGVRVPYNDQTNQVAEIYAVTVAHRKVPPFAPMHIVSDSKYVVDGITKYLPHWERRGSLGVANATVLRDLVGLLRTRSAPTTFRWVKGHDRVRGNEEADRLAGEAVALPPVVRPLFLPAPDRYNVRGAALLYMTQRLAYQGVREWKGTKLRDATTRNVLTAQCEVSRVSGVFPKEDALWAMLRKDPISKKARDFTWKALHESHRVGKFWSNIPGYEGRGTCAHCGITESMEHILTQCRAPGQQTAWALARGILDRKQIALPAVSYGLVLGAHTYTARDQKGEILHGATRLARLILSETAYLIWVLRCERVVGDRVPLTDRLEHEYVEKRWMRMIANRFQLDRILTSKRVAARGAVPPTAVVATWERTLQNEPYLPPDWIKSPEVLVGKPLRLYVPEPG